MPVRYRPNWQITKWLLVSKHLKNSLKHIDDLEYDPQEVEFIAKIIEDLEGKQPISELVDTLLAAREVPDLMLPRYARDTDFENYETIEDLNHRLYEHEDNYGRGRLAPDELAELMTEIDRRKVREAEQTIQRAKPPKPTD